MADGLKDRLGRWSEPEVFRFIDDDHLEGMTCTSIRNKRGAKPYDYLVAFLMVARNFGFATRDTSWGELEKILGIVFRNQVRLIRLVKEAKERIEELEALNAELESDNG